ncbi:MAG: flavodoxin domain-containing protein [Archangium sp.]|nr:flavodoxin domain-containing protein [Archangium sp.]
MRVLVAYGSKRGGTEGLARAVGEGLVDAGHSVDVLSAEKVDSLERYDGVVVGGALYAWFWQRDARRFVKRHLEALQQLPVWFFSSGPLDDSAKQRELPPPGSVARLARLVGAQQHKTFGGRMLPGVQPIALARGDFRDLPATRAWGQGVGEQLHAMPARERVPVPRAMPLVHRLVFWLCLFTGITAIAGGAALISGVNGVDGPPLAMLEHSPFETFLVPGLLLLVVVGMGNLAAATLEARRIAHSELAVSVAGAAVTVWIVTQLVMIRTFSWLQVLYFGVGVVTFGAALWLWRVRHRLAPHRIASPLAPR